MTIREAFDELRGISSRLSVLEIFAVIIMTIKALLAEDSDIPEEDTITPIHVDDNIQHEYGICEIKHTNWYCGGGGSGYGKTIQRNRMEMTMKENFNPICDAKSILLNEAISAKGESPEFKNAVLMAAEALREKEARENPQPLTFEELRQMDIEPVWVVPAKDQCMIPEWCVYENEYGIAYIPGYEGWKWELKNYGKTWIAYRHKPKEE